MNILSDSDLLVIKEVNGQPDGFPMTYSNFRLIHPQTSFPDLPDNSFLVDFGYKVFKHTNQPPVPQFETIADGPIVWSANLEAYTNTYVLTPFTPAQMERARQIQLGALVVEKNTRLLQCDWTQLPDVTLTPEEVSAWRVYRQQLRDYMNGVTDPFNPPAWPVPPRV
jgi:hypothetical protein